MSDRGEVWVHGNSVVAQYLGGEQATFFTPGHRMMYAPDPERGGWNVPGSDLLGVRSWNGAIFRGTYGVTDIPNTNWFHFSIPTPAIVPQIGVARNQEIIVDVVSMYYKTSHNQVTVQKIVVSDAARSVPQPVNGIEGAHLYGDYTGVPVRGRNNWMINPMHLRLGVPHGILISAEVRFDVSGDITFTAAAIHYSVV
jgi:hypothetical protein